MPAAPLRRAFRSPRAWWACAAAVALLAALHVGRLDEEAAARRAAWGAATVVVVATADLDPGAVIGPDDVRLDRWPAAVVAPGAVTEPPVGRTVVAPILAGEAVAARRLAPEGLGAVAALLPDGARAVAIPTGGGYGLDVPPVAVGDRVDVLATADGPAAVLARAALVVHVGETATTVAVPETDLPAVTEALTRGTVALALVGAG